MEEASQKILRQGFFFRIWPFSSLSEAQDPDCWLTVRLCCYSCACKGDRKMVYRMRKDKVSGISCYGSPLWMILLSVAEAVVHEGHD